MELNLVKGERIDLTKTNPSLKVAGIGLGWDAGNNFDLDVFVMALESGKLKNPTHLLYFNSPKVGGKPTILAGALIHSGDNLTGVGDGDDETVLMDISKLPAEVTEVLVCVNIYQADSRRQNFGQVQNAFIRAYDNDSKQELFKYDLSEDYSAFTAMIMGKFYKKDGEWKFQAIGEGKNGSISEIAGAYQ